MLLSVENSGTDQLIVVELIKPWTRTRMCVCMYVCIDINNDVVVDMLKPERKSPR